MNLELKPCPFCGHKANLFVSENDGVRVLCVGCGASSKILCDAMTSTGVSGNAVMHVIESWNRRSNDESRIHTCV